MNGERRRWYARETKTTTKEPTAQFFSWSRFGARRTIGLAAVRPGYAEAKTNLPARFRGRRHLNRSVAEARRSSLFSAALRHSLVRSPVHAAAVALKTASSASSFPPSLCLPPSSR